MGFVCHTSNQIRPHDTGFIWHTQNQTGHKSAALFGIPSRETRPNCTISHPFRADPYRVKQAANTTGHGTRAHCIHLGYVQALRDHPLIALCAATYTAIASIYPDSFILSGRPWLAQCYHNGMQPRAAGGYPRLFVLQR